MAGADLVSSSLAVSRMTCHNLSLRLSGVWCADQSSIFAFPALALISPLLCVDPGLWAAAEPQLWG